MNTTVSPAEVRDRDVPQHVLGVHSCPTSVTRVPRPALPRQASAPPQHGERLVVPSRGRPQVVRPAGQHANASP